MGKDINQNIKKYISTLMTLNGHKKHIDYDVSTSCLYLHSSIISVRHKIKISLQTTFPDVIFTWELHNKLIWIL